jgi:hypothetical protein
MSKFGLLFGLTYKWSKDPALYRPGSVEGVYRVKRTLVNKFQFEEKNVETVFDITKLFTNIVMLSKIRNTLYQLTPEDKFFLLLSGHDSTHPFYPLFVVDTNDFIYENHLCNVLGGPSRASFPYLWIFVGQTGCFASNNICQECGKMKRYICYPNHG